GGPRWSSAGKSLAMGCCGQDRPAFRCVRSDYKEEDKWLFGDWWLVVSVEIYIITSSQFHQAPEHPSTRHQTPTIHAARNTKQVLLPPKPKELDMATRTGRSWAWLAMWHKLQSGSGSFRLMVGGMA